MKIVLFIIYVELMSLHVRPVYAFNFGFNFRNKIKLLRARSIRLNFYQEYTCVHMSILRSFHQFIDSDLIVHTLLIKPRIRFPRPDKF